ncbi:MAG: L-lactate permease, partial [Verrucomicrobiota bacterium]
LASVGGKVAMLHGLTGVLMPLLVVCFMTRFFGPRRRWSDGLEVAPFALFAALAMIVPYILVARFLGPEFPSLLGSLIGLAIVVTAARAGFLCPAPDRTWDFENRSEWPDAWNGRVSVTDPNHTVTTPSLGMFRAWFPYLLIAVLLVLTRLKTLPFKDALQAWSIGSIDLFGTGVSVNVQPLYLPGTVFVLVSLVAFFLHRMPAANWARAWSRSARTLVAASVALVFTVPMVQVFINSGGGSAGFDKMPIALARGVESLAGSAWPLFAPVIGGLGAFVAGSNTVRNMMFSLFQFEVGSRIGVNPEWVVALQAVGGAAGNVICVHNVVAASAVVGLVGKEGLVLRKTVFPFLYYALFSGAIGYAIVEVANGGGWVNLGTSFAAIILLGLLAFLAHDRNKA